MSLDDAARTEGLVVAKDTAVGRKERKAAAALMVSDRVVSPQGMKRER